MVSGLLAVLALVHGQATASDSHRLHLEKFASGLEIPWDMEFAPDGRAFATERPGRIRVIENGELQAEPWATMDVANWRAAGMSGLAISPNFEADRSIFVMATFGSPTERFVNRIYRFRDQDGVASDAELIVGDIPSIDTHAGGALDFGPDGKLYVAIGDIENIELVQSLDSLAGKILRYNPDGSIPADNPFPDSPIWAFGLRNPQGFAWHPDSKIFYATEHGPSGYPAEGNRRDQDELNRIEKGGNYGWPVVSGMHQDERFIKPLVEWTPAIAPSGLSAVSHPESPWYGNLLVGALRGEQLSRVVLDDNGRISFEEALFEGELGRIRLVAEGPDGAIYFSTSNIDTPGEPRRQISRPGDDHIYRLTVR